MGSPRRQPQSTSSPQRRLHTSLLVPAQSDKKSHNNKLLYKSSQAQLPVGGIASAVRQKFCRIGSKSTVPGLLQPVISDTQTQQPVATYLRCEHTEQLLENTVVQNGDSRDFKDLPPGRGVGDLHRFQRHILLYTNKQPVQEVHAFSYPGQDFQFKALPFGLSTASMEFTVVAKEVKFLAVKKGIRIHQYPDDWLVRARSHQTCLQHTQTLVALWAENWAG